MTHFSAVKTRIRTCTDFFLKNSFCPPQFLFVVLQRRSVIEKAEIKKDRKVKPMDPLVCHINIRVEITTSTD